ITPLVSVVTRRGRGHTDYLGTDLAAIAREKAGVAKPDVPFVTGERDAAVRQVLVAEAERRGANPVIVVDTEQPAPPGRSLGMKGRHQVANAWVALAALNALPTVRAGGRRMASQLRPCLRGGSIRRARPLDLRRGPQPRRRPGARRHAARLRPAPPAPRARRRAGR